MGWFFDGLDIHLYTLVAAPFVASLLGAGDPGDPLVKKYSSWIQASFLVGWALGEYLWQVVADAAAQLGGGPVGAEALARQLERADA